MAGKVVKTKSGKQGRTKNGDKTVKGKIKVYLDDGKLLLCSPENLTPLGFWD